MNEKEFRKLLDENKYQIFIFSSPIPIPLFFGIHTWFVINKKGRVDRIEFGIFADNENKLSIYRNFFKPTTAMYLFPFRTRLRYNSKLISVIEGKEKSVAEKMYNYIDKNYLKYPLKSKYVLTGPNSNTYTSWILNKFPEAKLKLPWNAFGKNYKIK